MKVVFLYRPDSEHSRAVEEFMTEFKKLHDDSAIEATNIDSTEGISLAELYDIMDHPAILVIGDDGQLLKSWVGLPLPLMDEVAGYLGS